jgi:hypothetical protein
MVAPNPSAPPVTTATFACILWVSNQVDNIKKISGLIIDYFRRNTMLM